MNEIDCYKRLYGNLVYNVLHYRQKLGWTNLIFTYDHGIKKFYINGDLQDEFTFSTWVKLGDEIE